MHGSVFEFKSSNNASKTHGKLSSNSAARAKKRYQVARQGSKRYKLGSALLLI